MALLHSVRALFISIFFLTTSAYADDDIAELVKQELIDDNYFILELNISYIETGEVLESYKTSYGFYISLESFIELTLFKIKFDYTTHDAEGWFIKEENKFSLDFDKKIIHSAGKEIKVKPEWMLEFNNEVYVNIALIEKIFPISLYVNYAKLLLEIRSTEKLPFIVNMERKNKKNRLRKDEEKKQLEREYISDDFKLLSLPIVELNADFETFYQKDEEFSLLDMKEKLTYDTIFSNNLLWMNSSIFSSGNLENRDKLRIELSRVSQYEDLLGPLKATQLYMGDIVEHAGEGKGFRITNNTLGRGSLFNKTIISGDSIPGWDIEIYHNDKLLDLITVGDDGRYIFDDIKLYYGENIIEIVQYGPYGEIKREIKKYNIAQNILKDKKINYDLQVLDEKNTVFNLDKKNVRKDPNFFLKLGRKVGQSSTIYAGVLKTQNENITLKPQYDYTLSYLTSFYSIQSEFLYKPETNQRGPEFAMDNNILLSSDYDATMRIKPFIIEGIESEYGMELDYSTKIKKVNYTLESSFARQDFEEYKENISTVLDVQRRFGDLNAVQKLDFKQRDSRALKGENTFIKRIAQFSNSATFHYDIMPEWKFTNMLINNNYSKKLKYDFRLNLIISSNFPTDEANEYNVEVNLKKELNKYINYRIFTAYDKVDKLSIGINFSINGKTILFLEPHTKSIMSNQEYTADKPLVSVLAYQDQNNNNFYDETEPAVEDISFIVAGRSTTTTNKKGVAIAGNISEGKVYQVFPDFATLNNPELSPVNDTVKILPNKGKILKLEFPFVTVGSVDGNIFNGKKYAQNVKVILYDQADKEVASYITDHEGFFFLPDVRVGSYYLTLSETSVIKYNLSKNPRFKIDIAEDNLYQEYLRYDIGQYVKKQKQEAVIDSHVIDAETQFKLDLIDAEIVARMTAIIPKTRPLPTWIQNIRIKSKPEKFTDYFEESVIDGQKHLSFYEVQLGSFTYYNRAIDFQNLLVGQAGHFFHNKHTKIIIADEVKNDDMFFVLKIDTLYNRSNAQKFCKEIKQKLNITCSVYQEVIIDKEFYSKEQAKIFWEFLKSCKKFTIKDTDEYFLSKILDKDKGYKYKMKIRSKKNAQRNLKKICKYLNEDKTICRVVSSVKLEESFNKANYLYKFKEISDTLSEYTSFIKIRQDEYDISGQDKVNYKLYIGKFINYGEARKFCTDLLLEVPKNCFPIKRTKTIEDINAEMDTSNLLTAQ